MKKFRLRVYYDSYVDDSDYYPLKILPMLVQPELLNLIHIFNTSVFKDSKGIYYGNSKKPIAYFPIEIYFKEGKVKVVNSLAELETVILSYGSEIRQISMFNIDKNFIIKHLNSISEYSTYPYFLELFCYSLEIEYNTGVLLSNYIINSPFQQKTDIYLYHPDELEYADIRTLLVSKDLDTVIPNFEWFAKEADKLITYYVNEISKFMKDPYRTIKANYSTGLTTNLNIELIPSIMERWGLIAKNFIKG